MPIVHIVLIQFKPVCSTDDVQGVCERMLALKDTCIHPTTKKPYLRMGMGGADNSPEGLQNGISHAFVSEFDSEQDRRYYLEEDPAHLGFVKSLDGLVEKVQVIDFSPGVF